jgi:hypothetical protein
LKERKKLDKEREIKINKKCWNESKKRERIVKKTE